MRKSVKTHLCFSSLSSTSRNKRLSRDAIFRDLMPVSSAIAQQIKPKNSLWKQNSTELHFRFPSDQFQGRFWMIGSNEAIVKRITCSVWPMYVLHLFFSFLVSLDPVNEYFCDVNDQLFVRSHSIDYPLLTLLPTGFSTLIFNRLANRLLLLNHAIISGDARHTQKDQGRDCRWKSDNRVTIEPMIVQRGSNREKDSPCKCHADRKEPLLLILKKRERSAWNPWRLRGTEVCDFLLQIPLLMYCCCSQEDPGLDENPVFLRVIVWLLCKTDSYSSLSVSIEEHDKKLGGKRLTTRAGNTQRQEMSSMRSGQKGKRRPKTWWIRRFVMKSSRRRDRIHSHCVWGSAIAFSFGDSFLFHWLSDHCSCLRQFSLFSIYLPLRDPWSPSNPHSQFPIRSFIPRPSLFKAFTGGLHTTQCSLLMWHTGFLSSLPPEVLSYSINSICRIKRPAGP